MNNEKKDKSKNPAVMVTGVFMIIMAGIYPLFYRNNYIDIQSSKLRLFSVCVILLIIMVIVAESINLLREAQSAHGDMNPVKERLAYCLKNVDAERLMAIIFAVTVLISALISDDPQEALLGTTGRRMGAVVYLLCIAAYLIVSRYFEMWNFLTWVFVIANIISFSIGILNLFGVDILGMYQNLMESQHGVFIGTIGNKNMTAGYLCLVLPAGMVLYYLCTNLLSKIMYGIFLFLGFFECYATASDSWILGCGVAFIVLFWFAMTEHDHMIRFLDICAIFMTTSIIVRVAAGIAMKYTSAPLLQDLLRSDTQSFFIGNGFLIGMSLLVAAAEILFRYFRRRGKSTPYRMFRKGVFVTAGILFLAVVLAIVAANCNGEEEWTGILSCLNQLKLTDSFGTNRGYIWKRTWAAWKELPFLKKIFGYGPNLFKQFIDADYGKEIRQLYGEPFIDAHNEFLQFLATTGIAGVIGYFGMIFTCAYGCARKAKESPIMIMGVVTIASYLAQGMVNNPQIFTTPGLFLFMGAMNSLRNYNHSEDGRMLNKTT